VNSVSVSRSSLGLVPLVASGTTVTSGAVLIDWQPGGVTPVNEYAESSWLPGASLARSRQDMTNIAMTLRLYASSESTVRALLTTWQQALAQFSYTITETWSGGSNTYTCCPATLTPDYVGYMLPRGTLIVSASIPRQP